ncbi:MAG: SAM-dependent methyltransferase [Deltaproteobacteria bacterium]|nr:SAM-dependent methyltransferase [Deltaproteobacteria bacterium]
MPHALRRGGAPARRRGTAAQPLRSYAAFVDAALFHPRWGYYSTGGVRFGEGGHYDTYPLALSPYFGRMMAGCAFRLWRRLGAPARFEICELGAGNGQLCLDSLLSIDQRAASSPAWRAFADATRYRIVERSPGLVARQRQQLGPLAARVQWTRADFAQRPPRRAFGEAGLIVANEVLDCLPHHKLVREADGGVAVAHVEARLGGRGLSDAALAAAMASPTTRRRVRFRETQVPLERLPGLAAFVRRYYPDWLRRRGGPPLFVAPRMPTLMASAARCYAHGEAIWVDYGATRAFHLRAPERRKAFAGPPRSGRSLFDAPGEDDITFMVDFTLAADAARDAGWTIAAYGPQALLAARAGVRLDDAAVTRIVQQRALVWMLAFAGVGPERDWRRGAVGWSHAGHPARVSVQTYARRSAREFLRRRGAIFQALITRR